MLLFEAKEEIDARIKIGKADYASNIPEYIEALELASKSIEAQMRLADILNDWDADPDDSTYSKKLVEELLNACRFDYEEETEDDLHSL